MVAVWGQTLFQGLRGISQPKSKAHYSYHFSDEDPEAQRDKMTCPRSWYKITVGAETGAQAVWLQRLISVPNTSGNRRELETKESTEGIRQGRGLHQSYAGKSTPW